MLLKNCFLIPELVEGYDNCTGDILIENDLIVGIFPCGEISYHGNVTDVNNFVIPGLFDLHVHLTLSGQETLIDNAKTPVQKAFDSVDFAYNTLKAGFTTVRDVGSSYNVGVELRNAIHSKKIVGPNIYTSGRIITPTENGNDFFEGLYLETDGPSNMLNAVRKVMKEGADFIKLMGTGAIMNPGGNPGEAICTIDELEAVVKAAKFKNTYVAIHCHGADAIKAAIIAGVRTIEHASLLDDECIELLLKSNETFIVPTFNIVQGIIDSVPVTSLFMKEKAQKILNTLANNMKKAYKAGLTMGFGTDQGASPLVHGFNAREFMLRKEYCNMRNIDLLKQATIDSAKIIGVDDKFGTIKTGKIADLVVLRADPRDDISTMLNGIDMVIKSGKMVD